MTEERKQTTLNTTLVKPLATTAGAIGLVQGIAWTVFSVLCICCYCEVIQIDSTSTSKEYYKLIYCIFLDGSGNCHLPINTTLPEDLLIKPDDVLIFMCFYLTFSVVWLGVSATIIWAMIHEQWHLTKCLFGIWSITTIFISIVDVVLASLVAGDYITNQDVVETELLVTYGIVMSLAARGYVLWIVNIIFAGIMMKYTVDIISHENKETTMPIIHGYESNDSVNPPWFNGSVKDFWATAPPTTTQPHNNNYDNYAFERSQSFHDFQPMEDIYAPTPTSPTSNNYFNRNPAPAHIYSNVPNANPNPTSFSEAIANKTATIGRNKGRRSPPHHVNPPVIPEPDYTPPNSPNVLKSVLRTKSNYNN